MSPPPKFVSSTDWLLPEPNRIEKQYWKDLWRFWWPMPIVSLLLVTGIRQLRRMEKLCADVF